MNRTVRSLSVIALLAGLAGSLSAAVPGQFGVKARLAWLETAGESAAFSALNINFAADAIDVESKLIPELDLTYAFTENWLLEVVLTIPQEHEVTLAGVGSLGDFKHLPPTFSAVYEFQPDQAFRPYVSAGVNVTWIHDVNLSVAGNALDLEDWSVGLALGAGFQYDVAEGWTIDASAKYVDLGTDVTIGGAKLTSVDVNPWLFSVGVVWTF